MYDLREVCFVILRKIVEVIMVLEMCMRIDWQGVDFKRKRGGEQSEGGVDYIGFFILW